MPQTAARGFIHPAAINKSADADSDAQAQAHEAVHCVLVRFGSQTHPEYSSSKNSSSIPGLDTGKKQGEELDDPKYLL